MRKDGGTLFAGGTMAPFKYLGTTMDLIRYAPGIRLHSSCVVCIKER